MWVKHWKHSYERYSNHLIISSIVGIAGTTRTIGIDFVFNYPL